MTYKYFNEQFKQQYMDENKSRNLHMGSNIGLLFSRIAPTEETLGKDLYDFSVAEILDYYRYYNTSSLGSLMVMNNQYKLYTAYAISLKVVKDNQNHYAEIDNTTLMSCVHKGLAEAKVITRDKLIEILESSDIENVSDKVIALALFEGIGGKNLTELTHMEPWDIDVPSKTVKLCSGRELKISDRLIEYCLDSANEYNFYNSLAKNQNKSYKDGDTRVLKRLSNSTVDGDLQRHKAINRRLDHMISCTNCNAFSVGALKESGRLEMIKTLMENGKTLREALKDEDMVYRYGVIVGHKTYIMKYGLE